MLKRIIHLSTLIALALSVMSSCKSTQTFYVHGTPGTEILGYGTIDQSGKMNIKTERRRKYSGQSYYHFLLAKSPESNLWVPFALDYRDHNRSFKKRGSKAMTITLGSLSLGGSVVGVAGFLSGSPEVGLAGLGVSLAGLGLMFPFALSSDFDELDYNYDYLKHQTTNNDLIK